VTEPQPTSLDDINNDDDELVALWWRRSDRLMNGAYEAAYALDWVYTAVDDRMTYDDTEGTVHLLDRLLDHPSANMDVVAENILDQLLETRGPELAPMIADLAARYHRWQAALEAVTIDAKHRKGVPALAAYLHA